MLGGARALTDILQAVPEAKVVLVRTRGVWGSKRRGGIGWRRMLFLSSRFGYSMMVLTSIDRLLKQESSRWWAGRDPG